jgi:GNAT superfamily N-acetyltransferase
MPDVPDVPDVPEVPDVLVRPMREGDIPAADRISDESYHAVDVDQGLPPGLLPGRRTPARSRAWQRRTAHLLTTDPGGCWVAESGGDLLGFATSLKRELMWVLASFAVRRDVQGSGVGRVLLEAAGQHGRGCLRGMLSASADPRALRRYRLAGFDLHPTMLLHGPVDRSALPVVRHVREGDASDFALMDSVDRATRGAAHGPDHPVLASLHRLVVVDRPASSGYAYVAADGGPALLAATDRRTAAALLWECLAAAGPDVPVTVAHVSPANQWTVDVGLAARLSLHQLGFLGLRRHRPPAPYLHHGSFL